MKAPSVLFFLCFFLWMTNECNCEDPRATYKKWAGVLETLKKEEAQIPYDDFDRECKATTQETLSWIYLKTLFETKKRSGILNYAWPRLSFYSEHLKALTESPSLEKVVLCYWNMAFYLVCLDKKCRSCIGDEVRDSNDAALIQLCDDKYPKPEEAEVSEERVKELAGIWKPPVESPGNLSREEVSSWIEAKLERKTKVIEKEGEDCYAPPQLTLSLSYLRRMWEGGTNTTEKTQKELARHPQFYAEKLEWLKGADKEIVSCAGGLVCGWDGVCARCGESSDPQRLGLREACQLDSIEDWEDERQEGSVTKYGSPLEAYKKWVEAFVKVKKRSVTKNSTDTSCSASVEQTISWSYLTSLFYEHQRTGVMAQAWPRILFYDEKLEEVLEAPEDVVFCDWKLGKDFLFLCLNGQCKGCREMNGIRIDLYEQRCNENLEGPPERVNKVRDGEAKGLRKIASPNYLEHGRLTLEEALSWNRTLDWKGTRISLEECDVPPRLTFSGTFLMRRLMKVKAEGEKVAWRWRTRDEVKAEMEANQTAFEALQRLKWAEKPEEFCRDDVVCGADGLCIPCEVAVVAQEFVEYPREACLVEVAEGVESAGVATGDEKWGALMTFAPIVGLLFT